MSIADIRDSILTLADAFLADIALYRRLRGGHWERWYIDICRDDVWLLNDHGTRPPCAFGTPICEEYARSGRKP